MVKKKTTKKTSKKVEQKHWTIQIADIRKAALTLESNMNKAGNYIWRLNCIRTKYGRQIADLKREETEILMNRSGIEYTPLLTESEQVEQFDKNAEWQIKNFIENNGVKKLK